MTAAPNAQYRARLIRELSQGLNREHRSSAASSRSAHSSPNSSVLSCFDPENEAIISTRQLENSNFNLPDFAGDTGPSTRDGSPEPRYAIDSSALGRAFPDLTGNSDVSENTSMSIEIGRGKKDIRLSSGRFRQANDFSLDRPSNPARPDRSSSKALSGMVAEPVSSGAKMSDNVFRPASHGSGDHRPTLAEMHARVASEDEDNIGDDRPPTVDLTTRSTRFGRANTRIDSAGLAAAPANSGRGRGSRNRDHPVAGVQSFGGNEPMPPNNMTPNMTQHSYMLPDLANLSELVSGVYPAGTPGFSRKAAPGSRFNINRPSEPHRDDDGNHPAIESVPIPSEEKAILISLQVLQDKVAELETENAGLRAEKQQKEKVAREQRDTVERQLREKAQREQREEAEKQQREKAERQQREKAERKQRERAERQQREKAERQQRERAEKQQREKAEKQQREKAEKQQREKAEKQQREEAERQQREKAEKRHRNRAEKQKKENRRRSDSVLEIGESDSDGGEGNGRGTYAVSEHSSTTQTTTLSFLDADEVARLRKTLKDERSKAKTSRARSWHGHADQTETGQLAISKKKDARVQEPLAPQSDFGTTTEMPMPDPEFHLHEDLTGKMSIKAGENTERLSEDYSPVDENKRQMNETTTPRRRRTGGAKAAHEPKRQVGDDNMTSAYILPDITIRNPSVRTSTQPGLSAQAQCVWDGLAQHDGRSCTVCRRISSYERPAHVKPDGKPVPKAKEVISIPRPVPVSERMPEPLRPHADDELTMRPSQPPARALTVVLKALDDELAHLKLDLARHQAAYNDHDASMAKHKRKALCRKIGQLLKAIDTKADQIYALYDVLEGQKSDGLYHHPVDDDDLLDHNQHPRHVDVTLDY